MTDEKYNGWVNYETWLMNLNLTNEESLYNQMLEIVKENSEKDDYDIGEELKNWIEESFYVEEYDIYKICDNWTTRDFQEIHWTEIASSLRTEETEGEDQ